MSGVHRSVEVMGILNVTPDSFSDGGRFVGLAAAMQRVQNMLDDGADWIDVGGESTRPGAESVNVQQELDRVMPVVEAIHGRFETRVSLDTVKPEVMRAGIDAGVGMINDVMALRAEGAIDAVKDAQVKLCLMHMQGEPRTMQQDPQYRQVTDDVIGFLQRRVEACRAAGIDASRVLLDPGFGFGKTVRHNFELFQQLPRLSALGYPVLVGWSRKSSLGAVTGRAVADRLPASVAAAVMAAERGAAIIRAHDVGPTVDALNVFSAARHWETL